MSEPQIGKTSEIDDLPEDKAVEEQGRSMSSTNITNVKRSKSAKTIIKRESNPKLNAKSARKERRFDTTTDVQKEMQSLTSKTSRNGRKQSLLDDPETNPMSSLDISPGLELAAENRVYNLFEQVELYDIRSIIVSISSRLTKL